MPKSMVDGHAAWDEAGNFYERRGVTRDFAEAAREIKRGARVGRWLTAEGVEWLDEAPSGVRSSTRLSRDWLETELRELRPIAFTKWSTPDSSQRLLLIQWDC